MITQKEYWTEVSSIVEELRKEIKAGRITTPEQADGWLHETIDGHEWVIYTAKSLEILQYTKCEDDAFEFNGLAGVTSSGEVYAVLAYWGLRGDVMNETGDLDALFEQNEESAS